MLFSAYAEVFPYTLRIFNINANFSLPTQRCFLQLAVEQILGRAFLCLRRGVSVGAPELPAPHLLFSAYAEVFLSHIQKKVSNCPFSLPTQRCFSAEYCCPGAHQLFSAYAEVFRSYYTSRRKLGPFLCLRRGVSRRKCTPKPRRTLFSAYAEVFPYLIFFFVFPWPFLCLRRGVSSLSHKKALERFFSLPTQRCFRS